MHGLFALTASPASAVQDLRVPKAAAAAIGEGLVAMVHERLRTEGSAESIA
jgi:hypothetical protein